MSGVNLQALVGAAAAGGLPPEGMEGAEEMAEEYGEEEGSHEAGANPFAALASNPNFALIR